ncbi:hypothetical protein [Nocardia brasiliensis]
MVGRHIAAPDEWSDAVLIFIIGLTRAARGRLRDRPLTAIANIVFDHGAHLISSMHARHPGNSRLRLLTQTDRSNGGMNRLFQFGGSSTGITTGDGYPLYELIVKPPATLPDRKDLSGSFLSMSKHAAQCSNSRNSRNSTRAVSAGAVRVLVRIVDGQMISENGGEPRAISSNSMRLRYHVRSMTGSCHVWK